MTTTFNTLDARTLDGEAFEQRYLIPGILAAGQPGGIYGAFKTLKTSCLVDLLLSVASGQPFLGRFDVAEPGPVMMMSGESGLPALQSVARRVCASRGLQLGQVDGFFLSTALPQLDVPEDVEALFSIVKQRGLKVLAIDPAYLAMDLAESAHNLFAVAKFLLPIVELCNATGCTVLVVHHCKHKLLAPFQPASLTDIAWSGFAEFSAQWLLLARRSPFEPETGHHELWLSSGGRAGHAGVWAVDVAEGNANDPQGRHWNARIETAAAARDLALERADCRRRERRETEVTSALRRNREKVIHALRGSSGATVRGLRDRLGINAEQLRRIVALLVEEGMLVACPVVTGGGNYEGVRLAEETTAAPSASGL